MNKPLNPNGVGALLTAKKIILHRAVNGWMVTGEDNQFEILDRPFFCFESTASLAKHLTVMLGESKWAVCEQPRDTKGHFVPQKPANEQTPS